MTVNQMRDAYRDRIVMGMAVLRVEGMRFQVEVVDFRQVFNRIDALVRSPYRLDERWVSADRLEAMD